MTNSKTKTSKKKSNVPHIGTPMSHAIKAQPKARPVVAAAPPPSTKQRKAKEPHPVSNSSFNDFVRTVAPLAGSGLSTYFGAGPLPGATIGSAFSRLLGCGDYDIKTNSLMPGTSAPTEIVPTFSGSKSSHAVRVREREFLGDIISSSTPGAFQNTTYPIIPTNSGTFPFLSRMAYLFDQWEPHGIVFEFVSTSSNFATNQALGTVVMATTYNVLDSAFSTKVVMENADYANSIRCSDSAMHGIECALEERPTKLLYTNSSTTSPPNFSTLGNFQLATVGTPLASTNLGELWISYDISFYKKSILTPLPNTFWNASGVAVSSGSPFLFPVVTPASNLVTTVTQVASGTQFTLPVLPVGTRFMFEYSSFSPYTAFSAPFINAVNCASTSTIVPVTAVNTFSVVQVWCVVTSSANNPSFVWSSYGTAAINLNVTASIWGLPPGFSSLTA